MKKQRPDALHLLMMDIQRDLKLQREERNEPKVGRYSNPTNWTTGRCLELIHIEAGAIGCFIEYFHKSDRSARRLLPAPKGCPVDGHELVSGSWYLESRNQGPLVATDGDSDAEIRAIKARFNELIDLDLEPIE